MGSHKSIAAIANHKARHNQQYQHTPQELQDLRRNDPEFAAAVAKMAVKGHKQRQYNNQLARATGVNRPAR